MTTVNMKSELLMESRLRAESRQPLQRRRLAKTASACAVLENGECDPDLNLAIQESLKLARENELRQQQANAVLANSNFEGDEENEPIPPVSISKSGKTDTKKYIDSKNDLTSSKSENKPSNELQGLLMLHLDLIQHQQELLTTRDKEIVNLKDDKEALKCRLERMERRMAILKQKEDVLENNRSSLSESGAAPALSSDKFNKRKSSHDPNSFNNRPGSDSLRSTRGVGNAAKIGKSASQRAEQAVRSRRASRKKGEQYNLDNQTDTVEKARQREFLQKRNRIHDEHSILRSEDLTGIFQYKPPFEDDDETIYERIRAEHSGMEQAEVEIPTWRFRTVPNSYTLEGTENLEDEVFIKRHQKPEYEEKRRKRWDLQRLRDQRMYEHLKEKEKIPEFVGPCRQKDNHTVTFFPSVEDITHIEVCEKIPVSAFGHPIPFMKPSEFELPWEIPAKKSKAATTTTPKTNHRWNSRRR